MNIEPLDLRCHITTMKQRAKLHTQKAAQHEAVAEALKDEIELIESEFENNLSTLKQRK